MEILVVNPNTTASMTAKIRQAAEGVAVPGTRITAVNPATGPESIEGFYDEALAVPGLLAEIATGRRAVSPDTSLPFGEPGLVDAPCNPSPPASWLTGAQARSMRSRFITLFHADTKSRTNAFCESSHA